MAEIFFNDPDFMTDGELATAEVLQKGLPANWSVICNKVLPSRYSSREIDFIVLGDQLVYAIDEKSWRGRITGSDTIWVREDNFSVKSPLNKIDMVSKVLAGHIRSATAHVSGLSDEFVLGCVSLTRSVERPSVTDPRIQTRVFLLQDICDRILMLDTQLGTPEVGGRRSAIKDCLYDLRARPKIPKQINDYTITDVSTGLPGVSLCNAVHSQGMERLLTVYQVPPNDTEIKDFYLQEFYAYSELARLGVCPDVQDPFVWSDDFLVVVTSVPEGQSIGAMEFPCTKESLLDELQRAAATFRAIAILHSKGLVHRSLNPESIYLMHKDDGWRANLIGLYACRRPNRRRGSISPILNRLEVDDPYAAPELGLGYEYAEPSSDTFSASLIFLERLTGRSISELKGNEDFESVFQESALLAWVDKAAFGQFFTDTLGNDPTLGNPIAGTGRLSAEQCEERVNRLIEGLA